MGFWDVRVWGLWCFGIFGFRSFGCWGLGLLGFRDSGLFGFRDYRVDGLRAYRRWGRRVHVGSGASRFRACMARKTSSGLESSGLGLVQVWDFEVRVHVASQLSTTRRQCS